jgi:hypothetical protein
MGDSFTVGTEDMACMMVDSILPCLSLVTQGESQAQGSRPAIAYKMETKNGKWKQNKQQNQTKQII